MAETDCEGWAKIIEIFPDMNFADALEENPQLSQFLRGAINANSMNIEHPLTLKECPNLDEDFSKYMLLNGLPTCDSTDKVGKLIKLIIKLFSKQNIAISEEDIELTYEDCGVKTAGQAFIQLKTEEQAKISAGSLNGYQLDKKRTFSAMTFPDYQKLLKQIDMAQEDKTPDKTDYLELNHQALETRHNQYAFQANKKVVVNKLEGQTKILWNLTDDERKSICDDFHSDKAFTWSPKGTYLVLVKSEKVEFIGGSQMTPILTINQPKVENAIFSPCERYVLLYQPRNDRPYSVWNFMSCEKIRDFEQDLGEDSKTFKWSHDGQYIAKMSTKVITKEAKEGETEEEKSEVTKTFISCYELPSMQMCEDLDGNKVSISVDGLKDFTWSPVTTVIVHTSFPQAGGNPLITFMQIPNRQKLHVEPVKNSQALTMYFHPQGTHLAVMNQYSLNKQTKYCVELFETSQLQRSVPHKQVQIERTVDEFLGVYWEPQHSKLAIHTNALKKLEPGQKNFSNETHRKGIDIYQVSTHKELGFTVKKIGFMPPEKVLDFYFSAAGMLFCTVEQEALNRRTLNFYMVQKNVRDEVEAPVEVGNKNKKERLNLSLAEDTYDFKKTARHEVKDNKYNGQWEVNGRYFIFNGFKSSAIDRKEQSLRFFNMFGELIEQHNELKGIENVMFRPRPQNILKTDAVKKLKKSFVDKYGKIFKTEEEADKKRQTDIVKDEKKKIRDDFLDNFFIPLRKEYEADMEKYQKLFPIKDTDMAEEEAPTTHIYSYNDVKSTRNLDM